MLQTVTGLSYSVADYSDEHRTRGRLLYEVLSLIILPTGRVIPGGVDQVCLVLLGSCDRTVMVPVTGTG